MSLITAPYQLSPACRLLPLAVGLVVGLHGAPVLAETGSAWQAGNRGLSVSLDSLNRRYMEFDSQKLTPDGILDAEQGMSPTAPIEPFDDRLMEPVHDRRNGATS